MPENTLEEAWKNLSSIIDWDSEDEKEDNRRMFYCGAWGFANILLKNDISLKENENIKSVLTELKIVVNSMKNNLESGES